MRVRAVLAQIQGLRVATMADQGCLVGNHEPGRSNASPIEHLYDLRWFVSGFCGILKHKSIASFLFPVRLGDRYP